MKYVRFAAPFFIVSFLISLLLLIGRIDPDFFAYYYVGRAVMWGRDMFTDVAESKGPVTYLFFAALYWLFGRNYGPGIILASTILDAVSSILLFILVRRWLNWKPPSGRWLQWIMVSALVLYLKSFSINSLQGGLYSEQIGLPLLLFSLLSIEKRQWWTAGISFGCAVLARQSLAGYLLFVFVRLLIQKNIRLHLAQFLIGLGMVMSGFALAVWLNGEWFWAIENMILSVRWYSQATAPDHWRSVAIVLFREFRLLIALIFTVFFLLRSRVRRDAPLFFSLLALLAGGAVSVFAGSLVWDHHFLQLAPLFVVCAFASVLFARHDYVLRFFGSILAFSVVVAYAEYMLIGSQIGQRLVDEIPLTSEVAKKKYMIVYSLSPRVYIDYEKESPDRYYNPDFSLNPEYFGVYSSLAVSRHLAMGEEKARNTAFVFFSDANTRDVRYGWYLDLIRGPFHLKKQADYLFGSLRMEVYGWND